MTLYSDYGETPPKSYRLAHRQRHELDLVSKNALNCDDISQAFRYLLRILYLQIQKTIDCAPVNRSPKEFRTIREIQGGENEKIVSFRLDESNLQMIKSLSSILGYPTHASTVRFIIHHGYLYTKSLGEKYPDLVIVHTKYGRSGITFLEEALEDHTIKSYVDVLIDVVGPEDISDIVSNYYFRKAEEAKDLEILSRTREYLANQKGTTFYSRSDILAAVGRIGQYGHKKNEQVFSMAVKRGILTSHEDCESYIFR